MIFTSTPVSLPPPGRPLGTGGLHGWGTGGWDGGRAAGTGTGGRDGDGDRVAIIEPTDWPAQREKARDFIDFALSRC